MHLALIGFVLFLSHPLFATDLHIYRSITEIRRIQTGFGRYQQFFGNDEYENIIESSINWDGTPFTKQELFNKIDTLKDALVTVRQSNALGCEKIEAKIVDPNTMLLQNLETRGYFYADHHSIEYKSSRPDRNGTVLSFQFKTNTSFEGTLSYLMRGISWSPDYNLLVKDDDSKFFIDLLFKIDKLSFSFVEACNLRAYANIRNNQQEKYQVDNTKLYNGDIQIVNNYPQYSRVRKSTMASISAPEFIQLDGEQKGIYFYSLKQKYTLLPRSSIRLSFITVNLKCKFYYKTTTRISSGKYQGVFQRNYDLISDQFLPAGILTVRDHEILMGQARIPDISVNYTQAIALGQDNDVRYVIRGNLTASNKNNEKTRWQTYELNVTIFNYKNQAVNGQLHFYAAIRTTIARSTCHSLKVDEHMVHFPFELQKNNHYQCQIEITLKWK